MKSTLLIGLSYFLLSSFQSNLLADEERKLTGEQRELIAGIVEDLVATAFPELEDVKFKIYNYHSKKFFLESKFRFKRIFGRAKYKIGVNPKLFALDCSEAALRGILAHELVHTLDYEKMKPFFIKITGLGFKVIKKKSRIKYERKTDLKTIERGYGEELIEYRRWLYQQLSAKQLKKKREAYFTPEEIDLLMFIKEENPSFFNSFYQDIPLSLNEIMLRWEEALN